MTARHPISPRTHRLAVALLVVTAMLPESAKADGLDWSGSVGLGAVAASLTWDGHGAFDTAPLHLTDTRTAAALSARAAGEQAVSDETAMGVGFTATLSRGSAHLGRTTLPTFAELDITVRMTRQLSQSLVLRAGGGGGMAGAAGGGSSIGSNDNVVDAGVLMIGPVADFSIGYRQGGVGFALELRGGWYFEQHMTYMPLMLFAKVAWGPY